jgi:hypothetical protein
MDDPAAPHKIPLKKAFVWITLSVLAISGSATFGWLYTLQWKQALKHSPEYLITQIALTSPHLDALEPDFFAELLQLSSDKPTNQYQLNEKQAEKKLQSHPLIKKATVKAVSPNGLHIDYEMRAPVAYLGDIKNGGVDDEGVLIPCRPFFTPKRIPRYYLGLQDDVSWGEQIKGERIRLAETLRRDIEHKGAFVKSLDLTRIDAPSYGEREICVLIEEENDAYETWPVLLRLNHKDPFRSLSTYWLYREKKPVSSPLILDLRIEDLAFIL